MLDSDGFAEHMQRHFATDSLLRQCYPAVRFLILIVLSLVWHLQSIWAISCYSVVFVLVCMLAPLNPFRPRILFFVGAISIAAWMFELRHGTAAVRSVELAILLLVRIFMVVSVALLFLHLLDARAIMDIVRAIPLVRRVAPAVVSFVRLWPHSKWIATRVAETSHVRGYLRGAVSNPMYGAAYVSGVASPYIVSVIMFLDEYADVLALRGGLATYHRGYKWDYRKTPSTAVFVVTVLLGFVALRDWEIL